MNMRAIFPNFDSILRLRLPLLAVAGLVLCAGPSGAQTPTPAPTPVPTYIMSFKDGKSVAATSFRRSGVEIVATVQGSSAMAELAYPVGSIERINFPEPGQIESCTKLVLDGKPDEALAKIESTIVYYDSFKDIPGNWWGYAALVKLKALQDLHRDAAADTLIDEMVKAAPPNSEAARLAGVLQASIVARDGHPEKALPVYDDAINAGKDDETLGYAWAGKAAALYALQRYEPAVLAYLHLPVFYPDVKLLMPAALLGSAKCYVHIEHLPDAEKAFNDLVEQFPGTQEAAAAKAELKKIAKPAEATASPSPSPSPSPDNGPANSSPAPGSSPAGAPSSQ